MRCFQASLLISMLILGAACSSGSRQSAQESDSSVSLETPTVETNEPQFSGVDVEPTNAESPPVASPVESPEVPFPEAEFPKTEFPEIAIPSIKVQEGEDLAVITLPADLLFNYDEAEIRPDAREALRQVSNAIATRYPENSLKIQGHTDGNGEDATNQELSDRRAQAVERWLDRNAYVYPSRMTTEGFGEKRPVAANTLPDGSDNPQGRQLNRRIEIVIQK